MNKRSLQSSQATILCYVPHVYVIPSKINKQQQKTPTHWSRNWLKLEWRGHCPPNSRPNMALAVSVSRLLWFSSWKAQEPTASQSSFTQHTTTKPWPPGFWLHHLNSQSGASVSLQVAFKNRHNTNHFFTFYSMWKWDTVLVSKMITVFWLKVVITVSLTLVMEKKQQLFKIYFSNFA